MALSPPFGTYKNFATATTELEELDDAELTLELEPELVLKAELELELEPIELEVVELDPFDPPPPPHAASSTVAAARYTLFIICYSCYVPLFSLYVVKAIRQKNGLRHSTSSAFTPHRQKSLLPERQRKSWACAVGLAAQ